MERGSKRKAAIASAPSPDVRASKRAKTPDSSRRVSAGGTTESTTEVGLKLVEHLKNATDSHGRNYSIAFLTLPDKEDFPDYYEHIKLPIAIDTVEDKLSRRAYPTLTTVESDVKRLVTNAKAYNEKTSEIYADAERIRKLLWNFMKKFNPAYNDPNYVAFATPIPPELLNGTNQAPAAVEKLQLKLNGASKADESQAEATPAAAQTEEAETDPNTPQFKGKTLQEAQDIIVNELKSYSEGGLKIYEPFVNLPSRSLTDYYALIKQPKSLNDVLKHVRGRHKESETPGTTDLKSWDAYELEMSKIWKNAQTYNDDGSDMFNLATELKEHFNDLLNTAKKFVEEPAQPTLKLRLGASQPSIKLRLGHQTMSPAASASPAPASDTITVDQAALQRQQQVVQAGTNGTSKSRPGSSRSTSQAPNGTASAAPSAKERNNSAAAPTPPLETSTLKTEGQAAQTTVMTNGIGHEAPHLPPSTSVPHPAMLPPNRPNSGSPHPYAPQSNQHQYPPPPPVQPSQNHWRPVGSDASSALFNPLTISSPSTLSLTQPFSYSLPPDPHRTYQSITLTLPSTHHILLFTPTIRQEVFDSGLYRLFVTANGMRVMGGPLGGPGGDPRKPVHEVRLAAGVNRVDIEMVAEPLKRDGEEKPAGRLLDVEKASVFLQVLRP